MDEWPRSHLHGDGHGNPAPTVQWQVSTDCGMTYSNISGATGSTPTLSAVTTSQNGYRYRAVFTNIVASAVTSLGYNSCMDASGMSGDVSG